MKGTRPLDNNEIRLVSACFSGTFEVRNRGLFLLGVSTGGRISELLSLRIGDVWQNQNPVSDLLYDRSIVKGGEVSRAVPMNTDGMRAIEDLIRWHREKYGIAQKKRPLFPLRNGQGKQHMTRRAAHNVLKSAFEAAGLNGHLATVPFASRLHSSCMSRQVMCLRCRKCLGISRSRRPRGIWVSTMRACGKRCRRCRLTANFSKGLLLSSRFSSFEN